MRYLIDPKSSRLTVQAFAGGVLSSVAHNPTFAVRGVSGEMGFRSRSPGGRLREAPHSRGTLLELTDEFSSRDKVGYHAHDAGGHSRCVGPTPRSSMTARRPGPSSKSAGGAYYEAALKGDLDPPRHHPPAAGHGSRPR